MNDKKVFLSADIEGTCGIFRWEETKADHPLYPAFARQMTREVAAACEGALAGGACEVLVKDAHEYAGNLDGHALPRKTRLLRGWARNPYGMMAGLDASFYGAMMTGYHSAAGSNGNPLAHTLSLAYTEVRINGQLASELHLNALIAAHFGVPILLVTGDRALCEWLQGINPAIPTLAAVEGVGAGSLSPHPDTVIEEIRALAERAMALDPTTLRFPMPDAFCMEVRYREHFLAEKNSYYPGARKTGPHTVAFETKDFDALLRFVHFCL